jgi:hypothetical protein
MQEAIEELKRYYPTLQSIEIKTNQIKMIESQLDLINSKENIEMLRNRKKELRAEIKASEIFCEYVQPSSVYRSRKKAIENYAKATKKCK